MFPLILKGLSIYFQVACFIWHHLERPFGPPRPLFLCSLRHPSDFDRKGIIYWAPAECGMNGDKLACFGYSCQ